MTRYVIVGGGVAGTTAVEQILAADPAGRITILSAEPHPLYYRVRLTEYLRGDLDLERITAHPRQWYQDKGVDLRLGETAVSVDTAAGEVTGASGAKVPYDRLLLATGAEGFQPPVAGADKAGVFRLRRIEDADAIMARARECRAAALVGGGLLGLEAAYSLTRLGLGVDVVEMFDRLLPRQMDPAGAAKLKAYLESLGMTFHLGAKVQEVTGDGEARGLRLADGTDIPAGLVLFSAGIRPNLDLARSLGLAINQGVVVNDRLETSHPGIWAAGDLAEHRGRVYGLWTASREQGLAAGKNMAGHPTEYTGTLPATSLKIVDVDLTSAGDIDPEDQKEAAVVAGANMYRKIVFDQGRIAGFIFYGTTAGVSQCRTAMQKGTDLGGLKADMADPDFDFARLA